MHFSLTAVATLSLPLLAYAQSQVLNLIPDNFDKVVYESNKPALVEFFAPWCGHCKNLAPVYAELAAAFGHKADKVSIANVDADAHRDLGKRFGIQGFPTLKWFSGAPGDKGEDYNGGRDLDSLTKFITEKTGVKAKGAKAATNSVQMLTDSSFKQQVGKDKHVLIAFTAPWCGHCKTLAPIYEKLASDFASEKTVLVAKVDAEAGISKALAQSQDISGYPTIKYFPAGSLEPEVYSGARTEEALLDFLNGKAGTHRVVGGGLDSTAGTIEAFDEILSKYLGKTGTFSDIVSATEEILALAKSVPHAMSDYYVKALAKITGNPEYAMKEQSRIASLLKKGGLTAEKIDDLQKRSNILAKFLLKDGKTTHAETVAKDEL